MSPQQKFQSTLPRGERPASQKTADPAKNFNPRSHGGSDVSARIHHRIFQKFQSTLPRGERLQDIVPLSIFCTFQSTLPRGERLLALFLCVSVKTISIHAPTGGATALLYYHILAPIFQSTLPRGERQLVETLVRLHIYFNPRSHGGSDNAPIYNGASRIISIHAPTGGATKSDLYSVSGQRNFNPRSHGGSDASAASSVNPFPSFQSTLPRGERPTPIAISKMLTNFNPRSHGGSDSAACNIQFIFQISIHAPTGGATTTPIAISKMLTNFNPRSHGGSDSKSHQI